MEDEKLMYIHPAPVRVWHWINAVGFVLLVLTGIQIRFAEMINLFSLKEAVDIHNYVGFVVIANYFLWFSFYFGSGKIKVYFPSLHSFGSDSIKQIEYYGKGIFEGEPNPFILSPSHKFNALQQQAYLFIMFLFLPMQMISGVFLWKVKTFENYISLLGGIKIVDTIHVVLFFFFSAFIIVHAYLATLGHTPFAHYKAMFTGYEEGHE